MERVQSALRASPSPLPPPTPGCPAAALRPLKSQKKQRNPPDVLRRVAPVARPRLGRQRQEDHLVDLDDGLIEVGRARDGQVKYVRPRLVADVQQVREPGAHEQRAALAAALEQRVGRDRRAHADGRDAARVERRGARVRRAGDRLEHAADALARRVGVVGGVLGQQLEHPVVGRCCVVVVVLGFGGRVSAERKCQGGRGNAQRNRRQLHTHARMHAPVGAAALAVWDLRFVGEVVCGGGVNVSLQVQQQCRRCACLNAAAREADSTRGADSSARSGIVVPTHHTPNYGSPSRRLQSRWHQHRPALPLTCANTSVKVPPRSIEK